MSATIVTMQLWILVHPICLGTWEFT